MCSEGICQHALHDLVAGDIPAKACPIAATWAVASLRGETSPPREYTFEPSGNAGGENYGREADPRRRDKGGKSQGY
jgi:hypothetical protein